MKPLVKRFSLSTLCLVGLVFVAAQTGGCLIPSNDPMPGDVQEVENPPPDVENPPPDDVDAGPLPVDAEVLPDGLPSVEVPIAYADAAFSPNGRYVLRLSLDAGGQGCLSVADLDQWKVHHLDDVCNLRWIDFSPDGSVAYLLEVTGNMVTALNLDDLSLTASYETSDIYSTMDVSPGGDSLVLTNKPTTNWTESQYEWNTYNMELRHLGIVRPGDNLVHEQTFPYAIRSIAFSPVDDAVLVTMSWWKEDGLPEAQVHFMNPVTGVVENDIAFPNCADEDAVQPEGTLAILSPNQCFVHPIVLSPPPEEEWSNEEEGDTWTGWDDSWEDDWDEWDEFDDADPASIIDLTTREFVGNLPGFGPVQFSPDGKTAVAFSRQETMMKQWNMFQQRTVGLVIIRLEDLYWKVVEYGDDEPDYFFGLKSDRLFLHDQEGGSDRVVTMDMPTEELTVMGGAPSHFAGKTMTADGNAIYMVYEGALRRLNAGGESVSNIPLDFTAGQISARPQNDYLIVTDADSSTIHLLDLASDTVEKSLEM